MQRIRPVSGRRPRQEGAGVLQITGEENGPQGRLLDLATMWPGAFPALKGGVRVGARTITTARLRPIAEALTRAPDCLGTLTIQSPAQGAGPPESCENCRFLDDCPEEYRQEAAGRCENWESGAT